MSDDQDLKALMSSEVFRNYLSIENEREANAHKITEEQLKTAMRKAKELDEAVVAFSNFETSVKENRFLKKAFLDIQKRASEDPEFKKKLGPKFMEALMLLDLEESTF